jgi:hypothetical protein
MVNTTFLVQLSALGDEQGDRAGDERGQCAAEMRHEGEPEETRRRRDRDLFHQISKSQRWSLRHAA